MTLLGWRQRKNLRKFIDTFDSEHDKFSLKAGVPYEQLVKDRILNVLGMNDTKITLP